MTANCVLPEECEVFVGLPISREAFVADALRGPADRFAASLVTSKLDGRAWEVAHLGWSREELDRAYDDLSAEREGDLWILRDSLAEAETFGASVHWDVTSEELLRGLCRTRARVVTVVAHYIGGGIEVRDGVVENERVAAAFAERFDGTIDLTVCNSCALHDAIRARLANVPRIVLNRSTAYLGLRVIAYRLTLRLLRSSGPTTFVRAYADAWARLMEAAAS